MTALGGLAVLARVRASRPEPATHARCDLCAAPVAAEHQHVVSLANRSLLCACRACHLLFDRPGADLAYLAVPSRYVSLPEPPAPVWDALELPVGTAFVLHSSAVGRPVALYPGPAGATESELGLAAWEQLVAAVPALATLRPDVEALLVHSEGQRRRAYLVPVDVCYELVGTLRRVWRGFDGGQEARAELAAFFALVAGRARPA